MNLRRLVAVLLSAWLLAPGQQAQAAELEPGWQERSIEVDRRLRWYRIYRPPGGRDGAPAVLLLHGGTQSMRKLFRPGAGGTRAWLGIADREGVVLIVPNGTDRDSGDTAGDAQTWNDLRDWPAAHPVDDVAFLRRVVDTQLRELHLDPRRIFIAGASNGGMMTYRLLIEAPGQFAAGAAFIANLPQGTNRLPTPLRATPIMLVNGTLDPLVPWGGGPVARNRGVVASTPETVAWWIASNRASEAATRRESLPDLDPDDGCRITLEVHDAHPGGAPVWLYTAVGGGHAMPSIGHAIPDTPFVRRLIGPVCKDAEGAELAWRFFQSSPLPRAP